MAYFDLLFIGVTATYEGTGFTDDFDADYSTNWSLRSDGCYQRCSIADSLTLS